MRSFRFFILFITLLVGVGLLTSTAEYAAQAQGANLLQNPGFEAGVYTFNPDDYSWVALYASQREDCKTSDGQYLPCNTAQVPTGWIPWWISQSSEDPDWKNRMPEYKPAKPPFVNRIHSGSMAAQYFTFHGTHTAGLLQVVTVPANAQLRFSIYGQAWSSASDSGSSDFPTPVNMRIGIDPTGGTNPFNPAIVWSDYKQPYDAYQQFVVEAQAQGDKVTAFTISAPDEARKHNDIYWDDAQLVSLDAGAPPPTAAPNTSGGEPPTGGGNSSASPVAAAPAIPPTSTPNAEGIIYAEVQSGDSFWSIAARNGLTIDEIYELNDAEEGDFVQVGDLLIVGYGDPPGTETEEVEAEAAEGEVTAEEAETGAELAAPEPSPSPAPPTATPASTGGEVCLEAFVDENENGLHDSGEPLKPAVAFTVYNGEQVVINYVTDGSSEPYCITGLAAGNYRITRSSTPNEVLTTDGEWAISVTEGSTQEFAFGSYTEETAVAELGDAATNSTDRLAEADDGPEEGGFTRVLVIAAVVVAVLLFVGVLVVILSARRASA